MSEYDDQPAPSLEVAFEGIRRDAIEASPRDLDEHLAVAVARRDVAAAHGLSLVAELWNDLAIMLDDMRSARLGVAREIEEMAGPAPAVVRPLTAEELAECEWPDDGAGVQ